jgi:hypothetical protein
VGTQSDGASPARDRQNEECRFHSNDCEPLLVRAANGEWPDLFGVVGRPFQGRYKAFHVDPGHVLAQVAHYIHLNPLSVRGVTGETLAKHRWSSLHRFVTGPRPAWLHGRTVLAECGALKDTAAGWRGYQDVLALAAMENPSERERKFAALC